MAAFAPFETTTDEKLVETILTGQGDVFSLLYERYHARIFRMAYGMTGRRDAAEDLTQEIFFRVFQKLSKFNHQSSFSTWFYRLAVNHCLNWRQRKVPVGTEDLTEAIVSVTADASQNPDTELLRKQRQKQITKALLAIKPDFRMVVVLKDLEGLSYEEIAERMNCSPGTVASRLNRARKMLAEKLAHLREFY